MIHINTNYLQLSHRYLFAEIAQQVNEYKAAHPEANIIRLGIGDVTRPLPDAAIQAMHRAVDECADGKTFRGYGPEHGYDFLIDAIIAHDFAPRGIQLDRDEVFISDGAKSDTGNIGDILATDNIVGITDPVYPVYVDTNIMAGRQIKFIPCHADNGFTGDIPTEHLDIIYLCYPNNPTGAVITKEKLAEWVNYALKEKALILYDSAYEAFISDDSIPHSIYEIEGAKECAIEFRSFSKTAGFTGVRCGYTIIPKELKADDGTSLNALWNRRQCSKFNGASYISQRGAEAIFTPEDQQQVRTTIQHYMKNVWRPALSLHLGIDARRRGLLALLPPTAPRRQRGGHSRRRLRHPRRGLRPHHRFRHMGQQPRSHGAHQKDPLTPTVNAQLSTIN